MIIEHVMPEPQNDPRVFYSSERTLLAWIRTGLAVIGMGFVVARFELTFDPESGSKIMYPHPAATFIGMGLVVLGAIAMTVSAWTHAWFCRTLAPHERPAVDQTGWTITFALTLALVGILMAAYIVLRSFE
jgi:putative membrane protein